MLKFAIQIISEFLYDHELTVYLCVFDRTSYAFSKELFSDIRAFIDDDYADAFDDGGIFEAAVCDACEKAEEKSAKFSGVQGKSLPDFLAEMDKPFAYKLFDWIDARGMTDVECYKKANVDKKTFSKIKCNPKTYKPSKQTAVAFAIALRLNFEETQDLLASAGLTLSGSFVFDKIIRYFILKGNYNIFDINEALFEFDQVLLGC